MSDLTDLSTRASSAGAGEAVDITLWPAGTYRKKPVEIEAYRFDNRLWNHVPHWLHMALETGEVIHQDKPVQHLIIKTLEGDMRADLDDWIIKGVVGEIYPCKPDVFALTYEPICRAEGGETS